MLQLPSLKHLGCVVMEKQVFALLGFLLFALRKTALRRACSHAQTICVTMSAIEEMRCKEIDAFYDRGRSRNVEQFFMNK